MNSLSLKRIFIAALILSISFSSYEAISFITPSLQKSSGGALQRGPQKPKKTKTRNPKSAAKAIKKSEAKERKKKKDYANYVKENQKRSIEIQTPVVQKRMKQNIKDSNSNYKRKNKSNTTRTKKAGRKYR
jgi:hypothetical protein